MVKKYIEEFKKYYRYSPTNLGKIKRIENYILKLEQKLKKRKYKMKKLYELPEYQNIKLYFDDNIQGIKDIIVIFDHIDGFYSYCWLEEDKNKIVHIKATTEFKKYKDGYKYIESKENN